MPSLRDMIEFVIPVRYFWPQTKKAVTPPPLNPAARLSDKSPALENLRLEYHEASEGFRSIYITAWQAGAALFIASGAILGVGANAELDWLLGVGFIPVVVWFWGIFWGMDRVGFRRAELLASIEEGLNSAISADEGTLGRMTYYADYLDSQKSWGVRDSLHVVALAALIAAAVFLSGQVHVFSPGVAELDRVPSSALYSAPTS